MVQSAVRDSLLPYMALCGMPSTAASQHSPQCRQFTWLGVGENWKVQVEREGAKATAREQRLKFNLPICCG